MIRTLLSLVILLTIVPSFAYAVCGDVDDDGTIEMTDGFDVLRAAARLGTGCSLARCDADGNGEFTDVDAVRVLRAASGLAAGLECGELGARRGMLRSLTAAVIVPGYEALDQAALALQNAIDALVAAPSEQLLANARAAWAEERSAWKRTEAFRIGPSESLRTRARIDWSPIRADRIEDTIASADSFSSEDVDALGSNVIGSLAIAYLLFDEDGGTASSLAALSGASGAARRSYLAALAANLRAQTMAVLAAWDPADGNFGAELVDAGLSGGEFASLKEAVDELVNRVIFTAEIIEETKLSTPLGLNRTGGPDPELLESARSGTSLADIEAELLSIRYVYEGRTGTRAGVGIETVLRDIDPALDARIASAIDEALDVLATVPTPLAATLVEDPDAAEELYLAVQDMRRKLVLDLVPALGVTLTFGGTDGD